MPTDPNPTWMGYSIGRWDGDTLVVETAGFNDRTWLDFAGHPHSEALTMTERFRRRDFGHIELQVTLSDPMVYAKPITLSAGGNLVADTDLIEYRLRKREGSRAPCRPHDRGEESRRAACRARDLRRRLRRHRLSSADRGRARQVFSVTLDGNQLLLDMGGKGKIPMIPLSQTTFSPRLLGTYEFVKDSNGRVTHMLCIRPRKCSPLEGVRKSIRRRAWSG